MLNGKDGAGRKNNNVFADHPAGKDIINACQAQTAQLQELTVNELKALCDAQGISYTRKVTKNSLIVLLSI